MDGELAKLRRSNEKSNKSFYNDSIDFYFVNVFANGLYDV